jgi:hypothetical protein
MNLKKIIIGVFFTLSSLFAIDPVSSVSVLAPHNSATPTNDTSISFTWSAPSGVAKYYYKIDTNSTNYNLVSEGDYTTYNSAGSSLTASVSSSGSYYLHIVAVDESDNTSGPVTKQVTSPIDIDGGTVTMKPSGGAITTDTNEITLSKSEAGTIYFTTDGTTPTTSSSEYLSPLTLGVGATIKAFLVDTAGNEGIVNSKTFTITNNPTIKTLAGDSLDGTTIATTNTYSATPISVLDVNGTDFTRYRYKIDSAATYTIVNDLTTNIDISSLSSGSHTIKVSGGDAYNFQTTDITVTFNVDNTPPSALTINYDNNDTVTIVNPANKTNRDTIITLSATDVNGTKYKLIAGGVSCPTTYDAHDNLYSSGFSLGEGLTDTQEVKVCMASKDSVGNVAKTSKTFTIDKSAPTITLDPSVDTSFSGSKTVTFSSEANASIYYILKDTNVTVSQPSTISDLNVWTQGTSYQASGTKYVYALAVDSVDNVGTYQGIKLTKQDSLVQLSSNKATIDFGSAETNTTITRTFTLTNDGSSAYDLNSSSVNIVGSDASDFNITTTNCIKSINSGQTCTETITFKPTTKGDKNGTVVVSIPTGTNYQELNITLLAKGVGYIPTFISDGNFTTSEDTNYTGAIGVIDADGGDDINYSIITNVSHGTLVLDNDTGDYEYEPTQDYFGNDSFTVVATDGDNNITQEVNITVTASNDTPTIDFTSLIDSVVDEDNGTTSYDLNISDVDGDELNITVVSSNTSIATVSTSWDGLLTQGDYDGVTLDFNITTVANAYGDVNITIMVKDNDTNSTNFYDFNVTSVNDAPVLGDLNEIIKDEDFEDFNITLSATDVEGSSLTYGADTNDTNITATISGNTLTLATTADYYGDVRVDVNVTDGSLSDTKSFILRVNSQNDAPTFSTISDINTSEDNSSIGTIVIGASDIEGDSLTYQVSSSDETIADVSVTTDGNISITPVANAYGDVNITVGVTDKWGGYTEQIFQLTLNPVDDDPTFNASLSKTTKDEDFTYFTLDGSATDVDGDTISYEINTSVNGIVTATIGSNGVITIEPIENKFGDTNITVTATANSVDINQTFLLSITSVNDLPVIHNTDFTAIRESRNETNTRQFEINATDADGDSLSYDVNSSDTNISTISQNGKDFNITTIANANGFTTITVSVGDGNVTVVKKFTVTKKDENITIADGIYTTNVIEGDKITTTLTGNNITNTIKLISNEDNKTDAKVSVAGKTIVLNVDTDGVDTSVDENGTITSNAVDNGITRTITLTQDGKTSAKVTNGTTNKTTSIDVEDASNDYNTTMADDGSVETTVTIGTKEVKVKIESSGVVKPTKIEGVATPKELPIGSNVRVFKDGTSSKVEFQIKLDSDTTKIELN